MFRYYILLGFSLIILASGCRTKTRPIVSPTEAALASRFNEKQVRTELMRRLPQGDSSMFVPDSTWSDPKIKRLSTQALIERMTVIYGDDDRYNVFESNVSAAQRLSGAKVACLVHESKLEPYVNGTFRLKSATTLGKHYDLCNNKQKFIDEPLISFGSGFAIAPDTFITAGHCLSKIKLEEMRIVYGYQVNLENKTNLVIKPEDIYQPVKVIEKSLLAPHIDIALLKLNKSVPSNRIAKYRRSGKISNVDKLYVVGYPCGLPLKITTNAVVLDNGPKAFFVTNADTYVGNSGSPVFSVLGDVVEGVLVRGEKRDYTFFPEQKCSMAFKCNPDGSDCKGEEVTRFSEILPFTK